MNWGLFFTILVFCMYIILAYRFLKLRNAIDERVDQIDELIRKMNEAIPVFVELEQRIFELEERWKNE